MPETLPIQAIQINRDARQRREISVEDLVDSIRKHGIIQPIVVDENNYLIAGERRLTAAYEVGLPDVPIVRFNNLSERDKFSIELEENIRRKNLPWQDEVRAMQILHDMYTAENSAWTLDQTAEQLSITRRTLSKALLVSSMLEEPMVRDADKLSTAVNAAERIKDRRKADESRGLENTIETILQPKSPVAATAYDTSTPELEAKRPEPVFIIHDDFIDWAKKYEGPKFNLLHCDFPYGVNVGDKVSGQAAAKSTGYYDDSFETYQTLLTFLTTSCSNLIADQAHLIFWFSMKYYEETKYALELANWKVDAFPLIWHKSDGAGILPDANRGPRRTYETALFASRGDRKIVRATTNSTAAATTRDFHTSEKPRTVLTHFLRMVVDDTTRLLDPTAGSGNAVRVGYELGAKLSVGIELDEEFAKRARANIAEEIVSRT